MGQYHVVLNVSKKERFDALDATKGSSSQLAEQIANKFCTPQALFLLVANSNGRAGGDVQNHHLIGSWAGDKIVVQGDYAEETDKGFVKNLSKFKDISAEVKELLRLMEETI